MSVRIGINGFGRMGRLALRAGWGRDDVSFVRINDPAGDAATFAHLLEFDSVHGRWPHAVTSEQDALIIDGKAVALTGNKAITDTDWSGCDVVIEASGKMRGDGEGRPPEAPVVPGAQEVPAGAISRANNSRASRCLWDTEMRTMTSRESPVRACSP